MRKLMLFTALAVLAGCGNLHRDNEVKVWISPDRPAFPRGLIIDGCRYWNGFGQNCDQVEFVGDADITIEFTEQTCGEWLAWDENNINDWSHIKVVAKCFFDKDGIFQPNALRTTIAHEIGHALGLPHVPPGCDLSSFLWEQQNIDGKLAIRRHSNGQIICGKAVMNPRLDASLTAITYEDMKQFDVRNRKQAVLNPVGPTLGEPNPPDAGAADGGGQ